MARLNEIGVPTESVDALKRRFVRQNRELAKNNSTQSIRIRCLEGEVSRLLTENLILREDILNLRNELENAPTHQAVLAVKERMEFEINALGQLVAQLGLTQKSAVVKNGQDTLPKRSPSVGWGRGNADILGDGSDGRLPTIKEDKYFPRRTLDAQEISNVGENRSESPDLGSPPVAHFQDEEPIKFDPQPESIAAGDPEKDSDDLTAAMSVNLETRRKRRESDGRKLAIRRMSVFHSPPERTEDDSGTTTKVINQALPIRAGAKRKLAATEEDVNGQHASEDFTFSRKLDTTLQKSGTDSNVKIEAKIRGRKGSSSGVVRLPPERTALGEKSVNTDPVVSPKKSVSKFTDIDDKPDSRKPQPPQVARDQNKFKDRDRRSKTATYAKSSEAPSLELQETAELPLDLPPKTPAASLDLFSPPPTEPLTARPVYSRDTPPPPPGLQQEADANGGRGSRRVRAAVNYAEPSLISKMRRPTKELCDAVGKDGRPLSVTNASSGKVVTIKTEQADDDVTGWKFSPVPSMQSEPVAVGSPLSKRSTTKLRIVRTDGESNIGSSTTEDKDSKSNGSAAAISTLLEETSTATATAASKKKPSTDTSVETVPTITERPRILSNQFDPSSAISENIDQEKRDSMLIFDFKSSSPPNPKSATENRPNSRSSLRRHSSISSLSTVAPPSKTSTHAANSTSKPRGDGKSALSASSSTRHKRQSSSIDTTASQGQNNDQGNNLAGADSAPSIGAGRYERAAARRRSMVI